MAAPEMRASDSDRDRVAAALREHVAEGRLTIDEFNERLERVYQSRTYGELARLTSDLPEIDLHRLPAMSAPGPVPARRGGRDQAGLKAAWGAWAGASAINWVIWLIVSLSAGDSVVYPWPVWVMGPWGVILLFGTIFGASHRSRRGT